MPCDWHWMKLRPDVWYKAPSTLGVPAQNPRRSLDGRAEWHNRENKFLPSLQEKDKKEVGGRKANTPKFQVPKRFTLGALIYLRFLFKSYTAISNSMKNVEPFPSPSDSAQIRPLCAFTISLAIYRPSPVP